MNRIITPRREGEPESKVCYHCLKLKPIEDYGIQKNKGFSKTLQMEVLWMTRRCECNACRSANQRRYQLQARNIQPI
jgi:hypothetical protein